MKRTIVLLMTVVLAVDANVLAAERVTIDERPGSLVINLGRQSLAEYVWNDRVVRRPYFKHLRTPGGIAISRNFPPSKEAGDRDDHPTMHPGLWLSFGDLGGVDFWRNKGLVKQVKLAIDSTGGDASFTVNNEYRLEERLVCTETCVYSFRPQPQGYLLTWDSTFRSEQADFSFGDQEEMGLGLRVHTPLNVLDGGEIVNSDGRRNGKEVWGQQAKWCRYGGEIRGMQVGAVLMPHPKNFRSSWFHARDYGLLVANPFGRKAMTKGEVSQVVVPRGKDFRLRFGVLVYGVPKDQTIDMAAAYREFLKD